MAGGCRGRLSSMLQEQAACVLKGKLGAGLGEERPAAGNQMAIMSQIYLTCSRK